MQDISNERSHEAAKALRLGVLLVLVFSFAFDVSADVGGGSGRPVSPYLKLVESQISPGLVEAKKKVAAGNRVILFLPTAEDQSEVRRITQVGLAFAKDGRIQGDVMHEVSGISEDATDVSVSFSEIKSLEVLGDDDGKVVVELRTFPAIDAEELLRRKPSYLELRKEYTKSVVLRVVVTNRSGGKLYLIGQNGDGNAALITPLSGITPGRRIEFLEALRDADAFWWAIPSVIQDPAYPHRLIARD